MSNTTFQSLPLDEFLLAVSGRDLERTFVVPKPDVAARLTREIEEKTGLKSRNMAGESGVESSEHWVSALPGPFVADTRLALAGVCTRLEQAAANGFDLAFHNTEGGVNWGDRVLIGVRWTSNTWVGSQFHGSANSVLILGESTYGDDPPLSQYIPRWCRGEQRDQTLSRIFNAFSGGEASSATPAEREAFWARVAFSNFVQQSVGPTRENRPTVAHYRNAGSSLPWLLERLRPRGMLILGIEQAEFSEPIVRAHGIPYVIAPHPTGVGVENAVLQGKWSELRSKLTQ